MQRIRSVPYHIALQMYKQTQWQQEHTSSKPSTYSMTDLAVVQRVGAYNGCREVGITHGFAGGSYVIVMTNGSVICI